MNITKDQGYKIIIVAAIFFLVFFIFNINREIIVQQSINETVSVTGEAKKFVAPDTARASFTMTRNSMSIDEATESVNSRINEMINDLESKGVKKEDIKTTGYNVYPEYNYLENGRVFDGYRVSQTLELKIRDLNNVSSIMSNIASYQVDKVTGLSFYVQNDEEIMSDLREDAIAEAKLKARELSKDLGVKIDKIVGFSESGSNNYPSPIYRSMSDGSMLSESASNSVNIPEGQNEFNSHVTITYQIGK